MSLLTESRARKHVTETRRRTPPAVFRPELQKRKVALTPQGPIRGSSGIVLTHTCGSFLSRQWCRGEQDARDDRTYRRTFIYGTQNYSAPLPTNDQRRATIGASHRHRHGHGSREAPDQGVVHGQPTEVRVPVAFRVQSHRQTWEPSRAERRRRQATAAQLRACSQNARKRIPLISVSRISGALLRKKTTTTKSCLDLLLEGASQYRLHSL